MIKLLIILLTSLGPQVHATYDSVVKHEHLNVLRPIYECVCPIVVARTGECSHRDLYDEGFTSDPSSCNQPRLDTTDIYEEDVRLCIIFQKSYRVPAKVEKPQHYCEDIARKQIRTHRGQYKATMAKNEFETVLENDLNTTEKACWNKQKRELETLFLNELSRNLFLDRVKTQAIRFRFFKLENGNRTTSPPIIVSNEMQIHLQIKGKDCSFASAGQLAIALREMKLPPLTRPPIPTELRPTSPADR